MTGSTGGRFSVHRKMLVVLCIHDIYAAHKIRVHSFKGYQLSFLPGNIMCFIGSVTDYKLWARIAHSVQRLATRWTVWGPNAGGGEIFRNRPYRSWGPLTVGTESFPGVKSPGRGAAHLAPMLKKEQSPTFIPLWAFVACSRVKFTFTLNLTFTFTDYKVPLVFIEWSD